MSGDRRDQDIEVFAVDDDGDGPHGGPEPAEVHAQRPPAPDPREVAETGASPAADEIRQGPSGDRPRTAASRVSLGRGRSITPGQLAAAVAALVVVAFLAGMVTGGGTGPRRTSPVAPNSAVVDRNTGEFGSVLPAEPSLTDRVRSPAPSPTSTAGPATNIAASAVYALQLASRPINRKGQSLERRDLGALTGPWSLIVRRDDGSLGRHSSVVTYPLGLPTISPLPVKRIRVGPATGYIDVYGGVIWPIGAKFARIRGDLGLPTLAGLGARVTVRGGRPVMADPPARFRVVASEPYRAPVVAESRYTDSLRLNSGPIDGLIFTDVLRCASFEEELYVEGSSAGGIVLGHPSVMSSVGGGNATLAWEPTPGTIVYIGYSGGLAASASTATLLYLTRSGRLLDRPQWLATHPSVVNNTNVYS